MRPALTLPLASTGTVVSPEPVEGGVDAFRAQDMRPDRLRQWLQRGDAGTHPVGQRGRVDLDAFPREGGALAVQRLVLQKLARQNHGQQAWPGKAFGKRMRGRGRLGDRIAIGAE